MDRKEIRNGQSDYDWKGLYISCVRILKDIARYDALYAEGLICVENMRNELEGYLQKGGKREIYEQRTVRIELLQNLVDTFFFCSAQLKVKSEEYKRSIIELTEELNAKEAEINNLKTEIDRLNKIDRF